MTQTRRIALSGLLTALAAVLLLLGGLIPLATFCAPVLAAAVLLPVRIEFGSRYAGAAWAASSILGLLLCADRELALVFLFYGWYPILLPKIAVLNSRILRVSARLGISTVTTMILYGLVMSLLGLDADLPASRIMNLILLLCADLLFLLMDRLLQQISILWQRRFRKSLGF